MIIGKSLTALGGGGLKPEIHVTAKAGALLNLHYKGSSIILQSYQLGASETAHTFVVNVSETSYVIEDATNGRSVETLVDTIAVFYAEIEYVLWLYKDGDQCTDVTGGWVNITATPYSAVVFNNTNIYMYYSDSSYSGYGVNADVKTVNSIDLTAYSMLKVQFTHTNANSGFNLLTADKSTSLASTSEVIENGILECDISNLSFNNGLCLHLGSGAANAVGSSLYVYRVWAE